MRNVTETVKQLIIINVLFGTLIVGDPAYKMLAMFFLRMTAFNYIFRICLCTVGICTSLFNMFVCTLDRPWRVLGSKSFYSSIFCGLGAALMHT
jgi:hypothetical protein